MVDEWQRSPFGEGVLNGIYYATVGACIGIIFGTAINILPPPSKEEGYKKIEADSAPLMKEYVDFNQDGVVDAYLIGGELFYSEDYIPNLRESNNL